MAKKAKEDIRVYGTFSDFRSYGRPKVVIWTAFTIAFAGSCVITHNTALLFVMGFVLLCFLILIGASVFLFGRLSDNAQKYIGVLLGISTAVIIFLALKPLGSVYERIHVDTGAQPPITVQNILGEDAEISHESWYRDESFFAASYEYFGDSKLGGARYHITTVNLPFLYEPSFKGIQEFHSWDDYMEIPAQEWNAERVYVYVNQLGYHYYLICYEDLILELNTEKVELSQEQIAMIVEKLSNFS